MTWWSISSTSSWEPCSGPHSIKRKFSLSFSLGWWGDPQDMSFSSPLTAQGLVIIINHRTEEEKGPGLGTRDKSEFMEMEPFLSWQRPSPFTSTSNCKINHTEKFIIIIIITPSLNKTWQILKGSKSNPRLEPSNSNLQQWEYSSQSSWYFWKQHCLTSYITLGLLPPAKPI